MKRYASLAAVLLALVAVTVTVAVGAEAMPLKITRAAACGDIPNAPLADPEGAFANLSSKLPKSIVHDYAGWPYPILPSAWANWKPKGSGPYKVAIVLSGAANSWYAYWGALVQKFLKRSPLVDKSALSYYTASNPTAVAEQIQAYNAAVQRGVDLIILVPVSPTAIASAVEAAGKAGIPTILLLNTLASPYTVIVNRNVYKDAAVLASEIAKRLKGEGNVLEVLGTPTAATSVDSRNAWRLVFSQCSGIKMVGSVFGFFSTALTKTNVLQWLSTNPTKVDAAIHAGAMGQGLLQAFQQSGRPMPVFGDLSMSKSIAAYWAQNQSKGYEATGNVGGATSFARLIATTALRMLAGQGPKINTLMWRLPTVYPKTIKTYVQPSWTPETPGSVENPPSTWWTDAQIDLFFNHPERKKGTRF